MRTDFFNEAIVTAILAASSGNGEDAPQSGPEEADLTRAEVLRERLAALMDRADRNAMQAGLPKDMVEAADFAVCAFIDEALLSSASWRGRIDWLKKPLQFARHGTATAGEDFYRILDALLGEADTEASATLSVKAHGAAGPPLPQEAGARHPLVAVLEIFALCLAQGFTGMFYNDPQAIHDRLDKIGRFVPLVKQRAAPILSAPARKTEGRRPLRKGADLLRRFDPLDWALWILPLLLTALFYRLCEARLDGLLQPFLQGTMLP